MNFDVHIFRLFQPFFETVETIWKPGHHYYNILIPILSTAAPNQPNERYQLLFISFYA